MASILAAGASIALVGVAVRSGVVATLGVVVAALAAAGFLVPSLRHVHQPTQVDRESYFGFVLNALRMTRRVPAARPPRRGTSVPARSDDSTRQSNQESPRS